MSTYITKPLEEYIESFIVQGQSTLDTLPKQLPDGRYLKINKCCACKQYTYTGVKKVNTTNQVFFRYVSPAYCKHCKENAKNILLKKSYANDYLQYIEDQLQNLNN